MGQSYRLLVATLILLLILLITAGNEVFSTLNVTIERLSYGEIRWPAIYFPLYTQGDFELFPFSMDRARAVTIGTGLTAFK